MLTIHYAGEYAQRAGQTPAHHHVWTQLEWVEAGEITLISRGRKWPLEAGQAVLIRAHEPHFWQANAPMRGLTFKFTPEVEPQFDGVETFVAREDAWLDALPRRAMEAWQRGDAANIGASCGLLEGWLHLLRVPKQIVASHGEAHWASLLDELARASGPLLTLDEMARRVHCSPAHFRRVFQARCQMSAGRYQMQQRMERARGLLQFTSLPVARIAEQVGFSDVSSFSKAFARVCGCRPSQVRGA